MLAPGWRANAYGQVEQDRVIRTGATASVIAHLSLVALVVFATDVHPFGSPAEAIAVNIVTTEEVEPEKPKSEPTAEQKPAEPELRLPESSAVMPPSAPASVAPPPSQPQAASAPQQQAAARPPWPERRAITPPAQLGSTAGGYRQPEPDLSVKYNVVLGLPAGLPPASGPGKSDQGFDAITSNADISSKVIAEFRQHLKSCSKLPASVQPSDHVMVKLRVFMTPDGRLAADPVVGGGSANVKAIELLQSAMAALKQCQPYKMLPADRYGEWKVLDLDFTPKDFSG
jgi:hypothetical protein